MNSVSARGLAGDLRNFFLTPSKVPDEQHEPRTAFVGTQRLALLAAFAALVMFRIPAAWVHGRFQAEEGPVFLAYAWHFPWREALFRPFAGYLNLGATAPSVLTVELVRSGILPLERAPYLTMGIALAFQLLPAVLILTGKARWLENRMAAIAALLIVAVAPASEEVFYNTLHIQFHLALCVALLLALDVPTSWAGRIFYGSILFLAPLCGPTAFVILPLFALRALIDRDRARLAQFAVLAIGAAIQLLLFYGAVPFRHALDMRTVFAALFIRLFLLSLTGIDLTNWAARDIWASQLLFSAAAAATIVVFGLLVVLSWRRGQGIAWLVLSAFLVASVSTRFGIFSLDRRNTFDVMVGERYQFVPLVLLGLSLIAMAVQTGSRARFVWILLALLTLINGALGYPRTAFQWTDGPDWTAEVRLWKSNHDYRLRGWPYEWLVDLSDRAHPCPPLTARFARSKDPIYCESGWIADFYRRQ